MTRKRQRVQPRRSAEYLRWVSIINLPCWFILVLLLACRSSAAAEPEIKIGLITDLSGVAAYAGQQMVRGARLAQYELMSQGLRVHILVEDHQLRTERAASAAQKLLILDGVDALVSQFSSTSIAVSPLAHAQKKPLLYSAAAVSILESNPYACKTFIDFSDGCRAIAAEWRRRQISQVAVLGPVHEATEMCNRGASMEYHQIIRSETTIGEPMQTQMLRLKSHGIQAVLAPVYEGDLEAILRAALNLKLFPLIGVSADSVSLKLEAELVPRFEGIVGFGLPEVPERFIADLRLRDPELPSLGLEHAVVGYIGIKELARSLQGCPRDQPACAIAQLEKGEPLPEFGFKGWRNRKAQFNIQLTEFGRNGFNREK